MSGLHIFPNKGKINIVSNCGDHIKNKWHLLASLMRVNDKFLYTEIAVEMVHKTQKLISDLIEPLTVYRFNSIQTKP